MAITVKHSKVSTIPDDADTSLVRPSDWNADHTLVGTVPVANGGTGAATLTGYVKGNGTSTMTASASIPSTDVTGLGTMSTQNSNNISVTGGSMSGVTISDYIPTTQKAAALGVATLDSSTKVPISQIPDSVIGALSYQGTWDAATNTPTLTSSVGVKGYYYVVSVAGSTNLNGTTDWLVGDWAVYNGTIWQKIDNTDSVTSVNGLTGAVVLTTTNVAEGTNLYYTDARARASVSAGTGISYNSTTGVITNASPSLGGDVVGPASATDNAIARFDTTTGKLLQNSVVTVGDTGAVSGVTTLAASTSVTTPIVQATNSGGLALKNSGGTTQMSVGAGGGDNMSINVSTNINGTNAQIDISPTGTGHVHINPTGLGSIEIKPTSVGTMDNITIGATTPKAITGTTVTATTFSGSGASLTSIPNSALVNSAITINGTSTSLGGSVSVGTVTSVTGTSPVVSSGGTTPAISMPAATTSVNGYLTSTDWNTFNSKGSGTVTSVSATAPITSSGGATPNLAMPAATNSVNGYLTSTDWTTFNGKQATLVSGTNIKTINTNSILGSGDLTISASAAGSTTQVQYNNAGAFAGSSDLTYASSTLTAPTVSSSNGVFSTPNGNLGAGNATRFKNRIINGNMVIDQRNGGASVSTVASGTPYTLDRWSYQASQTSKFTIQQNAGSVTPPTGFINYLGVTSTSAYAITSSDYFILRQPIEGLNVADLAWGTANAKTVTLSFQVYSSLTGTFGGSLENSANSRSYPFSYTVSSANTWTSVSVTIAGDTTGTWLTTNGTGIFVYFGLGVGSTYSNTAGAWAAGNYLSATGATSVVGTSGAKFYITGVQLEVGSSATGFEYVDYANQLLMCQRYYETTAYPDVTQSLNTVVTTVVTSSGNTCGARFYVMKRTAPTVVLYSRNGTAGNVSYSATGGDTPGSAVYLSATGWAITSCSATATAGIEFGWTASAEL